MEGKVVLTKEQEEQVKAEAVRRLKEELTYGTIANILSGYYPGQIISLFNDVCYGIKSRHIDNKVTNDLDDRERKFIAIYELTR